MVKKIRNTWASPRFTEWDIILLVTVGLMVPGATRTFDYLTGTDNREILSSVEDAFPLEVWGLIVGIMMMFLFLGLALKNHFLIWLGHATGILVYTSLVMGVLLNSLDEGYPYDGIRYASVLITALILHLILALRMGPEPLTESDHTYPTESVVRDNGDS